MRTVRLVLYTLAKLPVFPGSILVEDAETPLKNNWWKDDEERLARYSGIFCAHLESPWTTWCIGGREASKRSQTKTGKVFVGPR